MSFERPPARLQGGCMVGGNFIFEPRDSMASAFA